MKRLRSILFLAAVAFAATAQAQREQAPSRIAVRDGEQLDLRFMVDGSRADVRANEQLILTPVVAGNGYEEELSPLVVTGRIRNKVDRRMERLYGEEPTPDEIYAEVVVRNRRQLAEDEILYRGSVPFEPWMDGGRVQLRRELRGCHGSRTELPPVYLADIVVPKPVLLSFLLPAGDGVREECLTEVVHFPVGRYVLLREFAENEPALARIDSLAERFRNGESLSLVEVSLCGYASPEAPYSYNTRLAHNRARTVERYLTERCGVSESDLQLASVPEDWDSLRRWVAASDLPERDRILAAIDDEPNPDRRDNAIRRIDGGKTYRWLLRNVYPQLRRVECVVRYEAPPHTLEESAALIGKHPEALSLSELCELAAAYPADSPERTYVCEVAMECYPGNPCACANMAALALLRGDMQLARICFAQCADDPLVQNNLGALCLIEGDRAKAYDCFRRAQRAGSEEGDYNLAHFDELDTMTINLK